MDKKEREMLDFRVEMLMKTYLDDIRESKTVEKARENARVARELITSFIIIEVGNREYLRKMLTEISLQEFVTTRGLEIKALENSRYQPVLYKED